jgi:hypothetical protein
MSWVRILMFSMRRNMGERRQARDERLNVRDPRGWDMQPRARERRK